MQKEKLLKCIKDYADDLGRAVDYGDDYQVENLFYWIETEIGLDFALYQRSSTSDSWMQCEYYSHKLRKTVIWSYDVGNFDDADEMADYIINTGAEIKAFEEKLPEMK